jgi:hypothetical protein
MRPKRGMTATAAALAAAALALGAGQAFASPSDRASSCKVTFGGWITTLAGDKATFGGNVHESKGQLEYQDHGPTVDINVHSLRIDSVFCISDAFAAATITGFATIDGEGVYGFTLDLVDAGEPGRSDLLRIQLSNGYDSGEQPLLGGNVQIHAR